MNQNNDPRLGLPSGSSALEDSLCHRRWRSQKEWDEGTGGIVEEEPDSPGDDLDSDAEAGKRIHKLYAGEVIDATEAEQRRAEQAILVDARVNARWLEYFRGEPDAQCVVVREHRWWLKNKDGQPIYSGQTDLVRIRGKVGEEADILIGDLKGLWGRHDDATLNMQLRRYIALIAEAIKEGYGYTGLRSAFAYLNQPAKTMDPVVAQYDRDDIETAVFQMHLDIEEILSPQAVATPGPIQCPRCRAKLICEPYQQSIAELSSLMPDPGLNGKVPAKADIKASLEKLPGDRLAVLLRWLPALDNMVTLAKTEAKRRIRNDLLSVPGWQLKKNSPRTKIDNITELWNRIEKAYAVPAADFLNLCTVTKTNVETLTRAKSGLKGKQLDSKVAELIEGCTSQINVSDSLEESS